MATSHYDKSVFVNCPFDKRYAPIFNGIVFAIFDSGFVARSSLETSDSSRNRAEIIMDIIQECKFGVHDLSRVQLDTKTRLPRFNMPLELGMFLGAKRFGGQKQKSKSCLILDAEPHRYKISCSDISGQDIKVHKNDIDKAIKMVRNWLADSLKGTGVIIPGGQHIANRYRLFLKEMPALCKKLHLDKNDLEFNDRTTLYEEWLIATTP